MKFSLFVVCVIALLAFTVAIHENEQANRIAATLKGNCHPVLSPCQVRPKIVDKICGNGCPQQSSSADAAPASEESSEDADEDSDDEDSEESSEDAGEQSFSTQHITTKTTHKRHADGSHTTTTITAIPHGNKAEPEEESAEEESEESSEDADEESEESSEEDAAPEPAKPKKKHLKINSNVEVNVGGPSPNMPKASF